ncbi:hypothetical protein BK674_07525 [Pseudomonas moraviensis]|uniref:Uncharacterized protein n=1 Tax=Pseudomonas moraviensis TaxID=321662 RepID=A0A423NU67_9PSED|nr:hypothetical protein [Pseudomonas moraviensis]ROO01769.1 hypothetical protein BK674_07525 [Pseudomonas moraviensis]
MELKDFIKNSLCQISEAILEASEELAKTDAVVNPTRIVAYTDTSQAYARTVKEDDDTYLSRTRIVEKVEFDVSVTTDAENKMGGGIKISVASVSLKGDGGSIDKAGSESRLKFAIPMVFPSKRVKSDV